MVYLLINASVVDVGQLNLVLLFGVVVLGGTFGARLFQRAHIPVVADEESNKLVGVPDYRRVLRKISAEVLHRRRQADEMVLGAG